MILSFFHDGPLGVDDEGKIHNGVLNDHIIERYFCICDEFYAVTRKKNVLTDSKSVITHKSFVFVAVPNINSIKNIISKRKECKRIIENVVKKSSIIVCRIPSTIGSMAYNIARKQKKRIIVEVVGCPFDSLRYHSFLGKLLSPFEYFKMKRLVKSSKNTIYVTSSFLQNRYPTLGRSIGCSDVEIPTFSDDILYERTEKIDSGDGKLVLGTCGVLDIKYKGQKYVMEAIRYLKERGITNIQYQLIGTGDSSILTEYAKKLNIIDNVKIIGQIPHDEVFSWLKNIDVYIQPSDTEGLCRAIIEAMSVACPCIVSDAGGNPELINRKYVFKKGNYHELAECLLMLLNKSELIKEAECNFRNSRNFNKELLEQRRKQFLINSLEKE